MTSAKRQQETDNGSGGLQERLGWSKQQMSAFLVLSPTAYDERLRSNQWSAAETERLELLEHAFNRACRVFSDGREAGRWLNSPISSLCNRRPADQLKTAGGLELVLETLMTFEHGSRGERSEEFDHD